VGDSTVAAMRTGLTTLTAIAAFSSALAACVVPTDSTDDGTDGGAAGPSTDVVTICTKIAACNLPDPSTIGGTYTVASCEAKFNGWIPPLDCANDYTAATCEDVLGNGANSDALNGTCYPSCSTGANTSCSGDNYTECNSNGQQLTFTCVGYCSQQSKTYAGVCGVANGTEMSPTGEAICWCQ
jgi:hypothetical protein